jgi:predicted transcriptional regulator
VRALLELLHKAGESGSTEIRKAFGLKDRVHVHKSYLQPALQSGYIEMTIPDKPNSRLQKYRLTDAGKHLLNPMQK